MKVDFLVIGTGLAGLNFIIQTHKCAPEKSILVITKSAPEESNTRLAQGGIAVVQSAQDSFEKHIGDTLIAGDGLCNEEVVKFTVEQAPKVLDQLLKLGANFDKDANGNLDLGIEGGHSEHRIIHSKDNTGYEIERCLIEKVKILDNVELRQHHFAVDLVCKNNVCYGAKIMNESTGEINFIEAGITFLATGGIGRAYEATTNPKVATGDGIVMASRAGATIKDMEFVQFHPTALFESSNQQQFLISEAVRGLGAKLCHKDGSRFMFKYDKRGSLASRDIVSRAISKEMALKRTDHVFLDCTDCDESTFNNHFPNIIEKCKSIGIDPIKDLIPVVPTQHYLCGGIVTDMNGQTSIERLFAAGECAHTGLHGANRLASNSLLEAFVFSSASAMKAAHTYSQDSEIHYEPTLCSPPSEIELTMYNKLRYQVQSILSKYAGPVRSTEGLSKAQFKLQKLSKSIDFITRTSSGSIELFELRNILAIAHLIINQSLARSENRGGFYSVDLSCSPV